MENRKNGQNLDIEKFRKQWEEIRSERDKERKIFDRLIANLRKTVASAANTQKLDKVFEYFSEQLEVLRAQSLKQTGHFNEMTEKFKTSLKHPDNLEIQQSLQVQLA